MAVVKANAYGHGGVRVAKKLEEIGDGLTQLHNHQQTLAYTKMQADMAKVAAYQIHLEQLRKELQESFGRR